MTLVFLKESSACLAHLRIRRQARAGRRGLIQRADGEVRCDEVPGCR
jgi:hypothetical protein